MSRLAPLACVLVLALTAHAHDDPEAEVARLTVELEREGKTVARLLRRAHALRELDRDAEALADVDAALELSPDSLPAALERGRVLAACGRAREALAALDAVARRHPRAAARAEIETLRSDLLLAGGDRRAAIEAARVAAAEAPDRAEAWLRLAALVSSPSERMRILAAARAACPHPSVEMEWVDAHLDAGSAAEVSPLIETRLGRARWRASWLLRRARAASLANREDDARRDLREALRELTTRIHPVHPNVLLRVDRLLVLTLLGRSGLDRERRTVLTRLSPYLRVELERRLATWAGERLGGGD